MRPEFELAYASSKQRLCKHRCDVGPGSETTICLDEGMEANLKAGMQAQQKNNF